MTFTILTVCTGNICRSPQAEQLLRSGFSDVSEQFAEWETPVISSAGTHALAGGAMPVEAAALSREYGGIPDHHAARTLTPELIEQADLVLAMAREHRSAIVRLVPRANRKVFTLREFARIVTGLQESPGTVTTADTDPTTWLARAAQHRGYFTAPISDDDVIDPYRRSNAVYAESAAQIAPAVKQIVTALAPRRP